ncbi:MAG: aminotransferase class I/II-fold pyridoxal phosphate-dependent enzyme [Candidatus Omnitrophota bacterium]
MLIDMSQRMKRFPPYLFAEIDKIKKQLKRKRVEFVDLSIGDPDIPAPEKVVEVLYESAKIKDNQKYALDKGKPAFRAAIKRWMKKRFKVILDEDKEILPLIGSKEGLVHFGLSFLNPGDFVIIPSPGYPGYRNAAFLAGGKIYESALLKENDFLPDLDKIPVSMRNKAKLIYLNYPNNPTTALAPISFLKKLVSFCSKYKIIIAYDNAYSELYFNTKPYSILEVNGAKEICVEFHSLSKTFCMTGFRVGFACGSQELISGLLKVKTNIDSGIFGAIQDAGSYALTHESSYVEALRKSIKERRDLFLKILKDKGFKECFSDSTFYVWARIPGQVKSSIEFSKALLTRRIIATPGVGFGRYGEGYIRFALTVNKQKLKAAARLML